MNYNNILLEMIESQLSFEDFTIDIPNLDKVNEENGTIVNVHKWIENDDLYVFTHGNGFNKHMILVTMCKMILDGELEITPTDKCSEKNVEYIKKLMSGLNN